MGTWLMKTATATFCKKTNNKLQTFCTAEPMFVLDESQLSVGGSWVGVESDLKFWLWPRPSQTIYSKIVLALLKYLCK